jgi:hypothetical protein
VKKLCGDLLSCTKGSVHWAKKETFSCLASDEITILWVKLCKLCRVKTIMIAVLTVMSGMDLSHDWLGYGWVGFVGLESSWVGSWYATGATPVCMVLDLALGGMPVSVVRFCLQV